MMLSLHNNATTSPAIRAKIAASEEPAAVLAGRYGVTLDTIYRWRRRTIFEDRSHTAHQLATTLTSAQEAVAVELHRIARPGGVLLRQRVADPQTAAGHALAELSRRLQRCEYLDVEIAAEYPQVLLGFRQRHRQVVRLRRHYRLVHRGWL